MTMVGRGKASLNTRNPENTTSRPGNYYVARLDDPTDVAAAVLGAICIAHERGADGISFSPQEARSLAAMLTSAADECDALIAAKEAVAS
jgi:hypothetical protein